MSKQAINNGTVAGDGTGENLFSGFGKVNSNFTEVYAQSHVSYNALNSRYWVPRFHGISGTPSAPGANSIRLFAAFIDEQITISKLACRVSTLDAAGLFQCAIYASNPTTGYPTGSALVSTADISGAAGGMISGNASLQLGPGKYWFATNMNSATLILNAHTAAGYEFAQSVGVQGPANVFATVTGLAVSQTYGTWPSLTAQSWTSTNEMTGATVPTVAFQIASVP